jgi:2-succinyl-5-enolpyruvyl-6-hydroxy-3-cyclohexene-1-carboxylate synthase
VIDNGGGGIFGFLPVSDSITASEMERLFTTPSGLDPAALAEVHGLRVSQPDTQGDFEAALAGDSQLILLRTNREENIELHRRINQTAAAVLSD